MFQYMSPEHKCDNNLMFRVCCLYSDNLYGPWFVFITECEIHNIFMEEPPSNEWTHVSGIHTHRAVKCCLNPLNHYLLAMLLVFCEMSHIILN